MLNIQRFVCNMFQENCYVVNDETNECVIIDCGAFYDEEKNALADYIRDKKLTPKHLLCTHGHIDHNFGNEFIHSKFNLKPEVDIADKPLMDNLKAQASMFLGIEYNGDFPSADKYFAEEDVISFGSHSLKIIHTPGHTPGSVFFYCEEEKVAFSGDTLFKMSIGRTDLQLGDFDAIMESLKNLPHELPSDTVILPGHGERTTMADELRYNPFLK